MYNIIYSAIEKCVYFVQYCNPFQYKKWETNAHNPQQEQVHHITLISSLQCLLPTYGIWYTGSCLLGMRVFAFLPIFTLFPLVPKKGKTHAQNKRKRAIMLFESCKTGPALSIVAGIVAVDVCNLVKKFSLLLFVVQHWSMAPSSCRGTKIWTIYSTVKIWLKSDQKPIQRICGMWGRH